MWWWIAALVVTALLCLGAGAWIGFVVGLQERHYDE